MSKVYSFKRVQELGCSVKEAWQFFSDPANLPAITPNNLRFSIISANHGKRIYAGQVIEYKVHPLFNIPVYWMTEMTHVSEEKLFVDEQRFGPYSFWHHQHHFEEKGGNTEMTDIVHYKIPFWIFGDIANALFVKAQLKAIFNFRQEKISEIFPNVSK